MEIDNHDVRVLLQAGFGGSTACVSPTPPRYLSKVEIPAGVIIGPIAVNMMDIMGLIAVFLMVLFSGLYIFRKT